MTALGDKIALITHSPGGYFFRAVAAGFAEAGIEPRYLVLVNPRTHLSAEWRRHRLGMLPTFVMPQLRARFSKQRGPAVPRVERAAREVIRVGALDSRETRDAIERLGVTYLVTGGVGIFKKDILSIPNLSVVNAHPGYLPTYRNMNVVAWALWRGDPVWGTVHRIDPGVDTGPIWLRQRLDLTGARNVEEAHVRAFVQVGSLVGPTVLAHARGEIQEVQQRPGQGTSFYAMHPFFRTQVDRRLGNEADR